MSHQHTPETETHLDEWHEHPVVVPKVENGAHINIKFLMIFYVSMVVFVLVTIVALVMFFGYSKTNLAAKLVENTHEYSTEYMPYAEEARGRLNEYAWVDRDAETVRVPWEVAARSVVANYGGPSSDTEESNN